MAILATISIGNKRVYEVDADPSVSGFSAPIGSLALFNMAGVGRLFVKKGNGNNDWQYFLDSASIGNLTTDDIIEGVANLYFTEQRVRDAVLTGLSLLDDADVVATDSVLEAIGKLQAQISGEVLDREEADLAEGGYVVVPADGSGSYQILADQRKVQISGVSTRTLLMPDPTNLPIGTKVTLFSYASGLITVQKHDASALTTMFQCSKMEFILLDPALATWHNQATYLRSSAANIGINLANRPAINMANPTNPQDGATKFYVDQQVSTLSWRFANDVANINDNYSQAFFGTKSGNFDISFYRNNIKQYDMKALNMQFVSGYTLSGLGNLTVSVPATASLFLTGSTTSSLDMSFRAIRKTARFFEHTMLEATSNNAVAKKYEQTIKPTILDGDATKSVVVNTNNVLKSRVVKLTIIFSASGTEDALFEKTVHIDKADSLILVQDDMTSKSVSALALGCQVSGNVGSALTIDFDGMGGMTGKEVVIIAEEIAKN